MVEEGKQEQEEKVEEEGRKWRMNRRMKWSRKRTRKNGIKWIRNKEQENETANHRGTERRIRIIIGGTRRGLVVNERNRSNLKCPARPLESSTADSLLE